MTKYEISEETSKKLFSFLLETAIPRILEKKENHLAGNEMTFALKD